MRLNLRTSFLITLVLGLFTNLHTFGQITNLTYPGNACQGSSISVAYTGSAGTYTFLLVSASNTTISLGNSNTNPANLSIPSGTPAGNYKIRVKWASDSLTGTANLQVNAIPGPPTASDITVCQGTTPTPEIQVTGTGLLWYEAASGGTGSSTQPTVNTAAVSTKDYYVSQTVNACESSRTKVTVAVQASPATPTVTPLASVCIGATVNQAVLAAAVSAPPGTLVWYSSESAGTPLTGSSISINTDSPGLKSIWVAAKSGNCESPRVKVDVTVNNATPAPGVSDVESCINAAPFQLTATGTALKWYTSATGGTGSGTAPTITPSSAGTTNYYVTQTLNGCESPRARIVVTVKLTPPPTVTASITYCQNDTPAALSASGTGLKWYTASTGGTGNNTAPVVSTATADTYEYYVSQTVDGCESTRSKITVKVNALPAAPTLKNTLDAVCVGATVSSNTFINAINAPSGSLVWYATATGGSPLTGSAITVNTTTAGVKSLWVAQRSNEGCEGPRTKVDIEVKALPPAPTVTDLSACVGDTPNPVLTAQGTGTLKWYTSAGSPLAAAPTVSTASASTHTYGVSQVVNGCEGPKATIRATVYKTPAPTVTSAVAFCKDETPDPLTATGTALKWYTAATGGTGTTTAPTVSTATVGTTAYYVSQTLNGCESDRARIDVRIKAIPAAPTVADLPDVCQNTSVTSSQLLNAVKTATGTLKWYTAATGGTGASAAPTPSTTSDGVKNFYVTQSVEACESPRALIKLEVKKNPVAPTVTATVDLCHQETEVSALTATPANGNTLKWYTAASGGTGSSTAPVPSTSTVRTTSYYVSQSQRYSASLSCEGPRAKIDVVVNPLPATAVTTDQAECQTREDELLNYRANTSGSGNSLVWFVNNTTSDAETTTPSRNLKVAGEFEYYVAQKSNKGCIGARKPVKIRVKRLPGLPNVSDVEYCQFDDAEPLTAKLETGATPNWYGQNATGGNASTNPPKPSTENGGTYSFYVSQTLEACEGDRAQIKVLIKTTPKPETQTLLEYCHNAPATPLSANGQRLKWYRPTGESQTNPFTPFTEAVGDQYFYVTQTGDNNCESPKEEIKITVYPLPTAIISGQSSIQLGGSAQIRLEFTGKGPWNYKLSDGQSGTADRSPFNIRVQPAFTTTYLVTEVSNECGKGTPSGSAVITVLRPTITTGNPDAVTAVCAGSSLSVPFQQSGNFPSGSKFVLQLGEKDEDASFKTIPSTVNGDRVVGTIPDTLAGGSYFLRVISENPNPDLSTIGSTSGVSITVDPKPTATLPANRTILEGQSTTLSIALTGAEPWTFTYTDGTASNTVTTSTTPYNLIVTPPQSVTYTITSVENRCGVGRSFGETHVQVDKILGNEPTGTIRVLPTLTDNECRVEIEALDRDGAELKIMDLAGRIVRTVTLYTEVTPIDVSTLTSGVYFFRVVNGQNQTTVKVLKP